MDELLQALRDLNLLLAEQPAEFTDDHLAEITNVAQSIRGAAEVERMYRATSPDYAGNPS
jgi:hypothetical protein